MKRFFLIGCLILCSLDSFSTCIAIYMAKNGRIYVAADSKRTFYFSSKYKSESVCKIHHIGAHYFAIAGIDDGGLLKSASLALAESADIDTAQQIFKKVMINRYTYLMNAAQKYYPEKFRHFLHDGLASVSFFGYNKGEPYITNIDFLVYLDDKRRVTVSCRTQMIADIKVIGITEDIVSSKPEDLPSEDLLQKNPERYVESLVKIEARKKPLAVSEPIDLLELSPQGPNWIRRNSTPETY